LPFTNRDEPTFLKEKYEKRGTVRKYECRSDVARGSILAVSALVLPSSRAQSPELQQKLTEIKESMAVNKMLLAQYTWMEQDIISIKGDQKKEELYNVQQISGCGKLL